MRKFFIVATIVVLVALAIGSRSKDNSAKTESKAFDSEQKVTVDSENSFDSVNTNVVWSADHETGNLNQWSDGDRNSSQDSGLCKRPSKGVSGEVAHSGKYSMKLSINSWFPGSACRQFRYPEVASGEPYYYSAWIYFPQEYRINGWTNIIQFKAKHDSEKDTGEVLWALRLKNRENGSQYFQLHWDDDSDLIGPAENDSGQNKYYDQKDFDVPAKEWVHVEIFLKQSEEFDGEIIVWQDGEEIYNVQDVRTKSPGVATSWSINSYGRSILPNPFTVYVDDVAISRERIWQ